MYCHDKAYLSKREHQRVQEIESERNSEEKHKGIEAKPRSETKCTWRGSRYHLCILFK